VTAFADDTAFAYAARTELDLYNDMQADLCALNLWFKYNRLSLNTAKTRYINFSLRSSFSHEHPLRYHSFQCDWQRCSTCNEILQEDRIRYLGLIVDERLLWRHHIDCVRKYLRSCMFSFYHLSLVCPKEILRNYYFAFVHSRLDYGITCYASTYLAHIQPLVVIQKFFVRKMCGVGRWTESYPLFCNERILSLRRMFVLKSLLFLFGRGDNRIDAVNPNIISFRNRLRSSELLIGPRPYNSLFMKTFIYLETKFINSLPITVIQSTTIENYKKQVKEWLLSLSLAEVEALYSVMT
jgi:hypothetical protein